MSEHVVDILRDLERVRENMLALSDEIWEGIDHNNQEALREGYEFKHTYNEKMIEFDRISEEISALIQQYTKINLDKPLDDTEASITENDMTITELNKETPYPLHGNFTFRQPYAFIIEDHARKELYTWKDFIVKCCNVLEGKNKDIFNTLTDCGKYQFFGNRLFFSATGGGLTCPRGISNNIFVETNLSANHSVKLVRELVKIFGISEDKFKIYLRKDQRA